MSAELERACALLRGKSLVAFPTETVYGLGGNALDVDSVLKIFETKGRPQFDPLIVHVKDAAAAFALAREVSPLARTLAARFWPGPLTLVLPKRDIVPDLVTSGLPSVALRVPAHPLARALLQAFDGPIAAPSANRFGRISPTTAEHVRAEFGAELELVLDGGPCETGVESTIVSLLEPIPVLLRPGGTPVEALKEVVGELRIPSKDPSHPLAPGQLPSHYAPRTPLFIRGEGVAPAGRLGLLSVGPARESSGFERVEVLSETTDLREAAARLFASMRRLDASGLDGIVAELADEQGLGLAINDRLRRASRK
ncbi:MAG: L-threonylcarbamoyladenylate synthase [Polyangiaceae bacterium]